MSLLLVFLQAGTDPVTGLLQQLGVGDGLARVLGPAITFVVAFLLVYLVGRLVVIPVVDRLLATRGLSEHGKKPLRKILGVVLVFVAVAAAFGAAGYGNFLTAFATIGAAATLAVGFAMQDVIANFVAGVFIFADRPFRIGDWIQWQDHEGVVEDISFRVTRVRTFDNELLTVPNSQLTDNVIKNPVAKDTLRMKFLFGIGYDDDIGRATEVIVEEAERNADILDEPAPSVRVTELGDSYVGLQSRFWIRNPNRSDFIKTRGDYVTAVKERFDAEGIEIPFPQRDLSGQVEMVSPDSVRAD
ncbi:mechanosensitive ion channel family protein [Halobium salinum]|uniref:Mechanosensitive ion channel family protein n=1 Tax=Halobium salinum TaxID=1364940 RepID=A0ABD5P738_9EURY|nr:mechanosensitive ion channel family protein [Halobium salinum]